MSTVTVTVDIDVDDALEGATTEDLVSELARRGREAVLDALIMLKTGRIDDGITALEREFFPRYADAAECEVAYKRAMAADQPQIRGGIDDYINRAVAMTAAAHGDEPGKEAAITAASGHTP